MATKRNVNDALRIGIYVVGCDKSWLQTPFLAPTFLIKTAGQIDKLRQAQVQYLEINLDRGCDVGDPSDSAPVGTTQIPSPVSTEQAASAPAFAGSNGTSLAAEFSEARRLRQTMLRSVHSVLECIRTPATFPFRR
jgi:hypothetical protein